MMQGWKYSINPFLDESCPGTGVAVLWTKEELKKRRQKLLSRIVFDGEHLSSIDLPDRILVKNVIAHNKAIATTDSEKEALKWLHTFFPFSIEDVGGVLIATFSDKKIDNPYIMWD